MKDKKAAKILIKRAKANPDLYTDTEVKYAKLIKKTLNLDIQNTAKLRQTNQIL